MEFLNLFEHITGPLDCQDTGIILITNDYKSYLIQHAYGGLTWFLNRNEKSLTFNQIKNIINFNEIRQVYKVKIEKA